MSLTGLKCFFIHSILSSKLFERAHSQPLCEFVSSSLKAPPFRLNSLEKIKHSSSRPTERQNKKQHKTTVPTIYKETKYIHKIQECFHVPLTKTKKSTPSLPTSYSPSPLPPELLEAPELLLIFSKPTPQRPPHPVSCQIGSAKTEVADGFSGGL